MKRATIAVLEAEDIQEAELEGKPCWFPTSLRDGDLLIDAASSTEAIKLPPSEHGYRYRVAFYRRDESGTIIGRRVRSLDAEDQGTEGTVEAVSPLRDALCVRWDTGARSWPLTNQVELCHHEEDS